MKPNYLKNVISILKANKKIKLERDDLILEVRAAIEAIEKFKLEDLTDSEWGQAKLEAYHELVILLQNTNFSNTYGKLKNIGNGAGESYFIKSLKCALLTAVIVKRINLNPYFTKVCILGALLHEIGYAYYDQTLDIEKNHSSIGVQIIRESLQVQPEVLTVIERHHQSDSSHEFTFLPITLIQTVDQYFVSMDATVLNTIMPSYMSEDKEVGSKNAA